MDLNTIKKAITVSMIFCGTSMLAHAFQAPANFSYRGFYAGLNGGYAYNQSKSYTTTTFVPDSYFFASDIAQIEGAGRNTLSMSNLTGGIEGGYNYVFRHILLGAEVDFESVSSSSSNFNVNVYQSAPPSAFTMYTKTTTNWLFTLRPRVGYVFSNDILLYLTGGVAIAHIKTYQSFSDDYVAPPPTYADEGSGKSQNKNGWVFGGGLEYPVAQHVTIKAEYLYSYFGNVYSSGQLSINPDYLVLFSPALNTPAPFNHSANLTDKMLRVGVNYNFG